MSALARTALRLAAIEALKADSVIAALVGPRIFDSRIESLAETEPVPVVTVLTEEMEGDAWSANNGGAPFDDRVELVLEIAMRAVVQPDGATAAIGTPETTAELEAALDLIEHRAVDALTAGDTPQALLLRQAVTRRVTKQKSLRYVDAETGIKLAERQVTLSASLKGEDQGIATAVGDPVVTVTAGAGDAGNGVVTLGTPPATDAAIAGEYIVAFSDASHFTVDDPQGSPIGNGTVGALFRADLQFTIAAGSTPFAAGDSFALTVTPGPFGMLPEPLRSVAKSLPQGSAGLGICQQIAAAIGGSSPALFAGIDATVAPQPALDPSTPPIPPADAGSHDSFGATIDIP